MVTVAYNQIAIYICGFDAQGALILYMCPRVPTTWVPRAIQYRIYRITMQYSQKQYLNNNNVLTSFVDHYSTAFDLDLFVGVAGVEAVHGAAHLIPILHILQGYLHGGRRGVSGDLVRDSEWAREGELVADGQSYMVRERVVGEREREFGEREREFWGNGLMREC